MASDELKMLWERKSLYVARLNIPTPAPPWPRKTLINSRPAARLKLLRVALLAPPAPVSEIKAASANDKEYK
jgi:hypothetical protein